MVLPTSISFGRRLVGLVSDVLFIVLTGAAVALAWRGWQLFVMDRPPGGLDVATQQLLQWVVPFTVEAALVLLAGRTVGELVVSVRAVPRRPRRVVPSRVVKLATGVAPVFVIALLEPWWAGVLLVAFAVVTLVVAWRTTEHRGLSHVLAGMDLRIGDVDPSETK